MTQFTAGTDLARRAVETKLSATCPVDDDPEPLDDDTDWAAAIPTPMQRGGRVRRATQRGMVTAEYAVGLLAAVALALVLLKVFTNNSFFSSLLKLVTNIIGKIGGMLP